MTYLQYRVVASGTRRYYYDYGCDYYYYYYYFIIGAAAIGFIRLMNRLRASGARK